MNVGQVMTHKVQACRPQDSLNIPAKLMWDNNCGSVAVVGDGRVVGMLTDRDICMAVYTQGQRLNDIEVSSAMSKKLFSCRPEDTLATAEKIMRADRIRRLPIIDGDGHLVGILSLDDIAREAGRPGEGERRAEITADEVCDTLSAICGRPAQAVAMTA